MHDGVFSIHNSHLWAWNNAHAICKHGYKVSFSISIWAGINGDNVMGSYLLPDRLIGQLYRGLHENVLPGLHEDVPVHVRQYLWFQHDGAPAYYREHVQQWLSVTYPGRWIGHGGPIA
jgi:hypothetical protein